MGTPRAIAPREKSMGTRAGSARSDQRPAARGRTFQRKANTREATLKGRDLLRRVAEYPNRDVDRASETALTRLARYTVAVAFAIAAWAISVWLTRQVPEPNYLPFAAAVALSTWYGGTVAGLVTSALS